MRQWALANVETRMTELTLNYADRFDGILRGIAQVAVMTAAYVERTPELPSEKLYSLLQTNLEHNPLVYGSAVAFEPYEYEPTLRLFVRYVYRDGKTLSWLDPVETTGYDYTDLKQEYWHIPRDTGKAVWTDPYFDEGAGNILMSTFSVPFFKEKKFLGIATIDIPLEPLRELIKLGISEDIKFSIITKSGKFIYSSHTERINKTIDNVWNKQDSKELNELANNIASGKAGSVKSVGWDTNEDEWLFYTPIKSSQWGFVASIPSDVVLQPVQIQFYRNVALFFISLVLVVICLWVTSRKISRPIIQLNEAVDEMSRGNTSIKTPVNSKDEFGALAMAFNEMTEKVCAREKKILESEKRFDLAMQFANDGLYDWNLKTNEIFYSPGWKRMLGYEDNEIKNEFSEWERLTNPEHVEASWLMLKEVIAGKRDRFEKELQMRHKNGQWVDILSRANIVFDENGEAIRVVGTHVDITDRKKMEVELAQSHKMEAIGTLAGGIAHDFNNILAAILGYADMAKDDTPDHSPAKYQIEQVLKAGNRAKDLVKHILSFSRKEARERSTVQIYLLAKEALKLLRASIPTTIEIRENIDSQCGNILAEPTQIHQVLMNLCTNAAQSMDETGGVLEVGLFSAQLSADDLVNEPNMKSGHYVRLIVKDSGTGIDQNIIDRIFDPYFTTKDVGKGSGMGLAVVIGIVKSHDGMVTVDSKLGEGTTFNVYLPIVEEQVKEEIEDAGPLLMGKEKILIVDDEETMVDMTKQRVERLGYQVTTKTSSIEALELFRSQPDAFDLVITDQTMPKLTGEQLAKELMDIRPNIPIILCTGYSSKVDAEKANLIGISAFIMKPVDKKELSLTIRNVLDRTS